MITEKKYWNDAYKSNFEATILRIEDNKVVLDQTYFYPEGGGQPSDTGSIANIKVEHVSILNDVIYHHLEQAMPKSSINVKVQCDIDFERRHGLMQQHSGQHLLSACSYKLFGAHTVGMHIGSDYLTIDLDKKLNKDEIIALENQCNKLIFQKIPITAHYPDSEKLLNMPLRKKPKVTENIRVIEIKGVDFSPCGGTHLKNTLEIGLLKIKRFDPYKSGVRVECVCGVHALNLLSQYNELLNQSAVTFSIKPLEILSYCLSLKAELEKSHKKNTALMEKNMRLEVSELLKSHENNDGFKIIQLKEFDLEMNDLRKKCAYITCSEKSVVLAQSICDGKKHIVFQKSNDVPKEIDMNTLFKLHLAPLNIRGGGNPQSAQGGGQIDIDLDPTLKTIENIIFDTLSS